eukprot:11160770-Alexandrium_andersonii.AAC.1
MTGPRPRHAPALRNQTPPTLGPRWRPQRPARPQQRPPHRAARQTSPQLLPHRRHRQMHRTPQRPAG